MKVNRSERKRAFVVFLFFCTWFLVVFVTLIKTQVLDYNRYLAKIKAQSHRILKLHPKRGTIYDSRGEVLAISVKTKSLFLSNKDGRKSRRLLDLVCRTIPLDRERVRSIRRRIDRDEHFIWVKRKLEDKDYARLKALRKRVDEGRYLGFIDEHKRIYPQSGRAAHILGGVGIDEQGLYGIEYTLDGVLKGKGGRVKAVMDARQRVFRFQYLEEPVAGRDVYLTIDSVVQFFVEKELARAVETSHAKGGAVVVLDPEDGRVLAMASHPGYLPGRLRYTPVHLLKNRAVSFLFDPGSTFKIVLASSALENKVCYPQQVFNCYNGTYTLEQREISDVHPYDKLTFEDIIIKSSNIGAARIGLRVGKTRFFETVQDFGFGEKTGIRLPAEERGILNPLERWNQISVASISFGYEISVTPLQMARAFNTIATGGYLVTPHLVENIVGMRLPPVRRRRVLSASTCHTLLPILTEVVRRGTGTKARIEGVNIAGKTGTAQKNIGGRYEQVYVSSFGGFFPAQNPRLTIFVLLDEPRGFFYGGDVAAPLFRRVAERLMVYLRVLPELEGSSELRI